MKRDLCLQKFGKTIAISSTRKRSKNRSIIWRCLCDCGNLTEVSSNNLLSGTTKSCGCLQKEAVRHANITHGDTVDKKCTRLYSTWRAMKARCYNPKYHNYKWYGSRGISVCNEWRTDYAAFREWAMGNGYADNLTIDRINNNGDYVPGNCQWITISENLKKSHQERRI